MNDSKAYCWIAGYMKFLSLRQPSDPEEDCASCEPGEWEKGQGAARENLDVVEGFGVGWWV